MYFLQTMWGRKRNESEPGLMARSYPRSERRRCGPGSRDQSFGAARPSEAVNRTSTCSLELLHAGEIMASMQSNPL
jgi:hypothetical protein